jgi:di/tricarboxylate transporter
MDWQGWVTLAVLGLVLFGMAREVAGPDLVMMAGLLVLATLGVLSPRETFAGFADPVMPTIGGLFVLSAALRETGAMEVVFSRVMGRGGAERGGLLRLAPTLAAGSAFMNNVTIVAMVTPMVRERARLRGLSHSRLLIPADYATILGGVTTLIGTSTTLVVAALMADAGLAPMGFFELGWVGLPVCLAGLAYLVLVAPRLLPDRRDPADEVGDRRREYTAALILAPGSPLVNQTVEEAGLRRLQGLYLVEIDRGGRALTPVGPEEILEAGDRLVFAGVVSTIVELQRMRGLALATENQEAVARTPGRELVEAVVSNSSPLVDRSIRDANFRTVYDAAVVAVHRNGERVGGKIGEIVLRPGDTLLLQTAPGFLRAHRNSPDFYLVSEVPGGERVRHERAGVAGAVLLGMVAVVASGLLPISLAALLAGGVLIVTRCISGTIARRSVEWSILIVIGSGLGIALAMQKTGAAEAVAHLMVGTAGTLGPVATLAVVYTVTLLLAEFLNHTAAAAIVVPIALAAAAKLGVDPRGFVMAVAIAASCAFAVPVSYQTHLIVYGPGGYRFGDFIRVGLPLDLLVGALAVGLIPLLWPF